MQSMYQSLKSLIIRSCYIKINWIHYVSNFKKKAIIYM